MMPGNPHIKILHLEDVRSDADIVRREMTKSGMSFDWKWVSSKHEFQSALSEFHPDLVISDHSLPGYTSAEAYEDVKQSGLDIPFILVTATVSEEFAVATIKDGVADYLLKDRLQRLPGAVANAMEKWESNRNARKHMNDLVLRNKHLEQYAYIVSHNLRGPVANIMGIATLLTMPQIGEKDKHESLKHVFTSAQRLDEITRDLNKVLELTRNVDERRADVSFHDLVNDIKKELSTSLGSNHATVVVDFTSAPSVHTVRSYLHSIFTNLITNSIKFRRAEADPIIRITTSYREHILTIRYADNGRGIDLDSYRDSFFGLYKRFHLDVEGKGMGLFMVKTQVEALGGAITVESVVGRGTEFTITL